MNMSAPISRPTLPLLDTPAFTTPTCSLTVQERALLAYDRAKAVGLAYDLTIDDLLTLSPKFWELHRDPAVLLDTAATTILTIQFNLCAGTIARYAAHRPELVPLVEDLLRYRKHGQFMLTERGHGLDISNLETTATLLPSGEFSLNSPTPSAAKFMPPTIPAGAPCIAVVFARLIVNNEDRGIRPFMVALNDGIQMCTGVKSRLLPERGGLHPVNHCLTSFHNVRLPSSALLGTLDKPASPHFSLYQSLWRIAVGTMSLGHLAIPFMQCYATIGAMYSLRRTIGGPNDRLPIMHFRTQQIPILTATAYVYVMQAFARWAVNIFRDNDLDTRVRHGIAAILKTIMVQHSQAACLAVSERCGALGLFSTNQLSTLHAAMRGIAIAEGDVLALSIRLTTEILQGKYEMPPSTNPTSLLARHESGLLKDNQALLATLPHHRSKDVNRLILPHCQAMVEAMGHRMAYDAAVAEGVQPCLIDLYVASVVKLDAAWYAENAQFGRREQAELETRALDGVLPQLDSFIREMDVEPYITAPIVSDDRWNNFVDSLELFTGGAKVDVLRPDYRRKREFEPMIRSHL